MLLGDEVRARHPDEHVRAVHRVGEGPDTPLFVGVRRQPATRVVKARVVLGDDAVSIDPDDVADTLCEQELADRHARGAHTQHDDADVLHLLSDDAQRVEQRGVDDGRRAVLIVVKDRYVEQFTQARLDLETARRGDVLQIDAAVHRSDALDDPNDLVDVLGVEAHRPRVDVGEALEQQCLALHDGKRGGRSDVAETEHRRTVGHDRDRVALDRELARGGGILGDGHGDPRHARGVRHRKVVTCLERNLGLDRNGSA